MANTARKPKPPGSDLPTLIREWMTAHGMNSKQAAEALGGISAETLNTILYNKNGGVGAGYDALIREIIRLKWPQSNGRQKCSTSQQ